MSNSADGRGVASASSANWGTTELGDRLSSRRSSTEKHWHSKASATGEDSEGELFDELRQPTKPTRHAANRAVADESSISDNSDDSDWCKSDSEKRRKRKARRKSKRSTHSCQRHTAVSRRSNNELEEEEGGSTGQDDEPYLSPEMTFDNEKENDNLFPEESGEEAQEEQPLKKAQRKHEDPNGTKACSHQASFVQRIRMKSLKGAEIQLIRCPELRAVGKDFVAGILKTDPMKVGAILFQAMEALYDELQPKECCLTAETPSQKTFVFDVKASVKLWKHYWNKSGQLQHRMISLDTELAHFRKEWAELEKSSSSWPKNHVPLKQRPKGFRTSQTKPAVGSHPRNQTKRESSSTGKSGNTGHHPATGKTALRHPIQSPAKKGMAVSSKKDHNSGKEQDKCKSWNGESRRRGVSYSDWEAWREQGSTPPEEEPDKEYVLVEMEKENLTKVRVPSLKYASDIHLIEHDSCTWAFAVELIKHMTQKRTSAALTCERDIIKRHPHLFSHKANVKGVYNRSLILKKSQARCLLKLLLSNDDVGSVINIPNSEDVLQELFHGEEVAAAHEGGSPNGYNDSYDQFAGDTEYLEDSPGKDDAPPKRVCDSDAHHRSKHVSVSIQEAHDKIGEPSRKKHRTDKEQEVCAGSAQPTDKDHPFMATRVAVEVIEANASTRREEIRAIRIHGEPFLVAEDVVRLLDDSDDSPADRIELLMQSRHCTVKVASIQCPDESPARVHLVNENNVFGLLHRVRKTHRWLSSAVEDAFRNIELGVQDIDTKVRIVEDDNPEESTSFRHQSRSGDKSDRWIVQQVEHHFNEAMLEMAQDRREGEDYVLQKMHTLLQNWSRSVEEKLFLRQQQLLESHYQRCEQTVRAELQRWSDPFDCSKAPSHPEDEGSVPTTRGRTTLGQGFDGRSSPSWSRRECRLESPVHGMHHGTRQRPNPSIGPTSGDSGRESRASGLDGGWQSSLSSTTSHGHYRKAPGPTFGRGTMSTFDEPLQGGDSGESHRGAPDCKIAKDNSMERSRNQSRRGDA